MRSYATILLASLAFLLAAPSERARAAEDAPGGAPPFKEGDVITVDQINQLKPYLPPEFWDNRDFFFFEGMRLEIGPAFRDYSPAPEYAAATERFKGQARLGPGGSLKNYTAGQPFPMDEIDCKTDPQAGTKIIWNFDYRWDGDGNRAKYHYTYWDRGEELPLYFQGTSKRIWLSHRVEPEYVDNEDGNLFSGENRKYADGIEVTEPFESRNTAILRYRYKAADNALENAKDDDIWVYVPTLRRVRRLNTSQRTDAVAGTDFSFDDLFSFDGIVPQFEWKCLGEKDVIAPVNSKADAYPYSEDHNFGPYGLSYANDRWELRHAMIVRMIPKDSAHPYSRKDIYIDKQTLEPLYSVAYDRKKALWKLIWHNHRWSEDRKEDYYEGWDGVPTPRDMKVVSDTIVNVQTGTGNRIEFWNNEGTPLRSRGKVRRYIDVGRLTRGR